MSAEPVNPPWSEVLSPLLRKRASSLNPMPGVAGRQYYVTRGGARCIVGLFLSFPQSLNKPSNLPRAVETPGGGSSTRHLPPAREAPFFLRPLLYLVCNPQPQWKCLQIYMVLFTGPLPISDTLKFPYMTHCCSDNKQVISWVGGQPPAGFDSLFLNQLKRLIKMQGPQSKAQETLKAGSRWGFCAPRHWVTMSSAFLFDPPPKAHHPTTGRGQYSSPLQPSPPPS